MHLIVWFTCSRIEFRYLCTSRSGSTSGICFDSLPFTSCETAFWSRAVALWSTRKWRTPRIESRHAIWRYLIRWRHPTNQNYELDFLSLLARLTVSLSFDSREKFSNISQKTRNLPFADVLPKQHSRSRLPHASRRHVSEYLESLFCASRRWTSRSTVNNRLSTPIFTSTALHIPLIAPVTPACCKVCRYRQQRSSERATNPHKRSSRQKSPSRTAVHMLLSSQQKNQNTRSSLRKRQPQ